MPFTVADLRRMYKHVEVFGGSPRARFEILHALEAAGEQIRPLDLENAVNACLDEYMAREAKREKAREQRAKRRARK